MEQTPQEISKQFFDSDFVLNSAILQNEFRNANQFCDLTLKGKDDVEINVHRVIVCSACGYIRDLLTTGMKETDIKCITLENISGDILEKIVSFMYEGKIVIDKVEDAEEILKHAPYLQMTKLVFFCTKVLQDFIDESSCLKYWRLSQKYLVYELRDKCIEYILKYSRILLVNKMFLTELTTAEFKEILSDDRFPCEPEFAFNEAVEWAKIKTSNTADFTNMFTNIIEALQVPLMSEEFILSKILCEEEMLKNNKVINAFLAAVKYKWTKNQGLLTKFEKSTMPKIGLKEQKYLILYDSEIFEVSADCKTITKIVVQSNLKKEKGNAVTIFHNFMFNCGGENSASCQYFCPITEKWFAFPDMTIARHLHACIEFSNKIYVCGGDHSSKIVEIFDFAKEQWMNGPRMNNNRTSFDLAFVNNNLYAVGGDDPFSIEMLDPRSSDGWTAIYKADDNKDGTGHYCKCASVGDNIYCFNKGKNPILDTRMNKVVENRSWNVEGSQFDVYNLNNDFGLVSIYFSTLEFRKFKLCGDEILQSSLPLSGSGLNPKLIALYY